MSRTFDCAHKNSVCGSLDPVYILVYRNFVQKITATCGSQIYIFIYGWAYIWICDILENFVFGSSIRFESVCVESENETNL